MISLVKLSLAALLAVLIPTLILMRQGEVVLRYDQWQVTTSLTTLLGLALLSMILLYALVQIWLSIWRLPKNLKARHEMKLHLKSEQALSRAILAQYQGQDKTAEKILLRAAPNTDHGAILYLAAAQIAQQNQASERALQHLQTAQKTFPQAGAIILQEQAKLLMQINPRDAEKFIQQALDKDSKNPHLWALAVKNWVALEDWRSVEAHLYQSKDSALIPLEERTQLMQQAIVQHLRQLKTPEELLDYWPRIPQRLHIQSPILCAYVAKRHQLMGDQGLSGWLLKALPKSWTTELLFWWGEIRDDWKLQVKKAETWLIAHPQDTDLLLALAKLYMQGELYGKAIEALQQRMLQHHDRQGLQILIQAHRALGDTQSAAKAYVLALETFPQDMGLANPQGPKTHKERKFFFLDRTLG